MDVNDMQEYHISKKTKVKAEEKFHSDKKVF